MSRLALCAGSSKASHGLSFHKRCEGHRSTVVRTPAVDLPNISMLYKARGSRPMTYCLARNKPRRLLPSRERVRSVALRRRWRARWRRTGIHPVQLFAARRDRRPPSTASQRLKPTLLGQSASAFGTALPAPKRSLAGTRSRGRRRLPYRHRQGQFAFADHQKSGTTVTSPTDVRLPSNLPYPSLLRTDCRWASVSVSPRHVDPGLCASARDSRQRATLKRGPPVAGPSRMRLKSTVLDRIQADQSRAEATTPP
jgi:hypothetical protein